jgi:hypothetical protein
VVEEEVRAGRMTPEQAVNHPSKNVISRALGAEETAEVDLKTIEVEDGTCFLLCSDGITRHIPDNEIRGILGRESDLAAACAEFKRRCFQRGAEDNLTAVIVRVGEHVEGDGNAYSDPTLENAPGLEQSVAPAEEDSFSGNLDLTEDALVPASRIAFPPLRPSPSVVTNAISSAPLTLPERRSSRSGGGLFIFLLFVVCAVGAFYAGVRLHDRLPYGLGTTVSEPPALQPTPIREDPILKFARARREVDLAPAEWLKTEVPKELTRQGITKAIDSTEPEFLYLYGRALLLSGNYDEAAGAFEKAVTRADASPSVENATIKKEASLALAASSLKSGKDAPRALTHIDEIVSKPTAAKSP